MVTAYDSVDPVENQTSLPLTFGSATTLVTVTVAQTLTVTAGAAGPMIQSNASGGYSVVSWEADRRNDATGATVVSSATLKPKRGVDRLTEGDGAFATYVVTPSY